MASRSRTDSATQPGFLVGPELLRVDRALFGRVGVAIEVKATRKGQVFELACRWCGRRGYHLRSCARRAYGNRALLQHTSELAFRWSYVLELAQRELANRGNHRGTGARMP